MRGPVWYTDQSLGRHSLMKDVVMLLRLINFHILEKFLVLPGFCLADQNRTPRTQVTIAYIKRWTENHWFYLSVSLFLRTARIMPCYALCSLLLGLAWTHICLQCGHQEQRCRPLLGPDAGHPGWGHILGEPDWTQVLGKRIQWFLPFWLDRKVCGERGILPSGDNAVAVSWYTYSAKAHNVLFIELRIGYDGSLFHMTAIHVVREVWNLVMLIQSYYFNTHIPCMLLRS